ncbi:MAG: ribonuclease HII [Heliobacteriaceae bacterium]|nr:ribonuclease HII [Heliobacteriaceae bacterium]MDD4587047.1 ribonuclease HII [Heliobacteriaceae bacterium]
MTKSSEFLRIHWEQQEKGLRTRGCRLIAGVDEAGRGPLAGPVVAGVVILPPFCRIAGLNDSKRLTANRRHLLAGEIREKAQWWAVAVISARVIDQIGILPATFKAMRVAVRKLSVLPDYLLVDGNLKIPDYPGLQQPLVGGDGLAAPVAAASILAKTVRDELMIRYARIFPGYAFEQHKGYGTVQHRRALAALGPTILHRKSFKYHLVDCRGDGQ